MYNFAASKVKKTTRRNDFEIDDVFDGLYLLGVSVKESSQTGGKDARSLHERTWVTHSLPSLPGKGNREASSVGRGRRESCLRQRQSSPAGESVQGVSDSECISKKRPFEEGHGRF